jgi:hypothetical protein
MLIYVDIDHTICNTHGTDYASSEPMLDRIEKINGLYDEGNTIVYWTARGSVTGIDHSELTKKQFKDWGVKYHELKFGKPPYDLFIDDKNINSENYF